VAKKKKGAKKNKEKTKAIIRRVITAHKIFFDKLFIIPEIIL